MPRKVFLSILFIICTISIISIIGCSNQTPTQEPSSGPGPDLSQPSTVFKDINKDQPVAQENVRLQALAKEEAAKKAAKEKTAVVKNTKKEPAPKAPEIAAPAATSAPAPEAAPVPVSEAAPAK